MCFGSDESKCTKDYLYRTIGLLGGNIKLDKNDYAGSDLLGTNGNYSRKATIEEEENTILVPLIHGHYQN